MYRDHSVGVVVPAYNEAGFVGEVLATIPEYVDRIYAVDDCSTDGTWREIREAASRSAPADAAPTTDGGETSASPAAASEPGERPVREAAGERASAQVGDEQPGEEVPDERASAETAGEEAAPAGPPDHAATDALAVGGAAPGGRVVAIRHEENRGVGGAIKTGYLAAVADDLDVVAVMGGDGQMDPAHLERLLDPIVEGRADYAKGNRLLRAEHHADMPRHRLVGNGILTLLTKVATGYWSVGDPQMGYTAIAAEAIEGADLAELYEYYGYCNDLLVRLSAAGYRVADVPCPLDYGDETSHISYSEYVPRVSAMLLRSFLRRLWRGKGSPAGAARLALFVGGALATAVGACSAVAGTVAPSGDGDGSTEPESGAPSTRAREHRDGAADATDVDAAAEDPDETTDPADPDSTADGAGDRPDESSDGRSGRSPALTIAVGVAVLLAAMLVDGVANAARNYTERVPEDGGE